MKEHQIKTMRSHLAQFLGFECEIAKTDKPCKVPIYITGPDTFMDWMERGKWRPDENLEQAMQVLNSFDVFCIEHYYEGYEVTITVDCEPFYSGECESLTMAICLAACRATKANI